MPAADHDKFTASLARYATKNASSEAQIQTRLIRALAEAMVETCNELVSAGFDPFEVITDLAACTGFCLATTVAPSVANNDATEAMRLLLPILNEVAMQYARPPQ